MLWFSGKNFWSKSNGAEREERRKELTPPFMRHWWIPGSSLSLSPLSRTRPHRWLFLECRGETKRQSDRGLGSRERERERQRGKEREFSIPNSESPKYQFNQHQSINHITQVNGVQVYIALSISHLFWNSGLCECVSFFLFFLVVSRSELSVCFLNLHHPLL